MSAIWVKILQGLRAQKNYALFALVSSFDDVSFTDTQIILPAHNDSEYQMLNKNLPQLQTLAGSDCLVITAPEKPAANTPDPYAEKLQELFGDYVEIL